MIDWKTKAKTPEEGSHIVCFTPHWKHHYPASIEFFGGEVAYHRHPITQSLEVLLINEDDHGKGAWAPDWREDVYAWCYAEEFKPALPAFMTFEQNKGPNERADWFDEIDTQRAKESMKDLGLP